MPRASAQTDTRDDGWAHEGLFAAPGRTSDRQDGGADGLPGPLARRLPGDGDERLVQLARAIELEIIPRLMLAHRAANECTEIRLAAPQHIDAEGVAEFARLVVGEDEDVASACIASWRERGASIEAIYLDLLAPAARLLGELWEQDRCDFASLTVGLGRMQRVLRELSPAFHDTEHAAPVGRRVLLLPSPGEQHTFGLVMVSEFFRRAGWDVSGGSWETGLDAPNLAAAEWYDVVGFSMGAAVHVEALADCIAAVRRASRNARVVVMAGGPLFGVQPELGERIGADVVATDGKLAPELAERHVAGRVRPAS